MASRLWGEGENQQCLEISRGEWTARPLKSRRGPQEHVPSPCSMPTPVTMTCVKISAEIRIEMQTQKLLDRRRRISTACVG